MARSGGCGAKIFLAVVIGAALLAAASASLAAAAAWDPWNSPDVWPAAGSNNQQANFAITLMNESGCLMTDGAGNDLIEGPFGRAPQPCPASSGSGYPGDGMVPLPITNSVWSFSVASRRIASLQAGDTLDATANIEVSSPDWQQNRPDSVYGKLILARSPVATAGITIAVANGGYLDWQNLQHHITLNARGSYRAWSSFSGPVYINFVLSDYTPTPCTATEGDCYDPCSEQADPATQLGYPLKAAPYDRICVDSLYGNLAVQEFRPAQPGQQLMAVEPMVSNPVTGAALVYNSPSWVWWSPPITNLTSGQIVQAHADLGFAWDGVASRLPSCEPNIWTQVWLINKDRPVQIPMTEPSPSTNLTLAEPRNTLSPYGSILISPGAGGNSDWSGTWYVAILAQADIDPRCSDDPTSVGGSSGASDAAAFRFRAAGSAESGWQEKAYASGTANTKTLSSGSTSTLYTSPRIVAGTSAQQVIDVASATELASNNCANSVQTSLAFNLNPIDSDVAGNPPPSQGGPSLFLPLTHGGAEYVPATGSRYGANVTLAGSAQLSDPSCTPTAPLLVGDPGGGVYVQSYWPTSVLAPSSPAGGRSLSTATPVGATRPVTGSGPLGADRLEVVNRAIEGRNK